jgi:protein gp37
MHPDWARDLRDQCQTAGVPFFFKQWGEFVPAFMTEDETRYQQEILNGTIMCRVGKKAAGRLLDGREWNEFPDPEMSK